MLKGILAFIVAASLTFGGVALGADEGKWTCAGSLASSHIVWAEGSGFETERLAVEAALEGSFGPHQTVDATEIRQVDDDLFEVTGGELPSFVVSILITVNRSRDGFIADEFQVCEEDGK